MSKHKNTNAVCIAIIIAMLAGTTLFMHSGSFGVETVHAMPQYANSLFNTGVVHTIDIQAKQEAWDEMLENAANEEYIQAAVVIDGEKISGVGIRPKGNSSLSEIVRSDSDRYSFKIEFDHYSKSINYHGLDKLALNNIVQDTTYMKDYASYQMMNAMGADAPLSSFIWVTVNGGDWGLYLAVEGIEKSFAQRVYGNGYGKIYKPDTMDMNKRENFAGGENGEGGFGGRGGNREGWQMPEGGQLPEGGQMPEGGQISDGGQMPEGGQVPEGGQMPGRGGMDGEMPGFGGWQMPEGMERPNFGGGMPGFDGEMPDFGGERPNFGDRGGFGGMGGGATTLKYTDGDPGSYAAIFDNAIFKVSTADKARLISSLKELNEGKNIDKVVNVDEVIRYFAVHNFVLNSDSYTGNLIHNYYLAENSGKLSMIAWDYNLAFGGMGGMGRMPGGAGQAGAAETGTAAAFVNYPIDSPMLSGNIEDRPMLAWIFEDEGYLAKYHEVYAEFVEYFTSGKFAEMYDNAIALISPYVEKDPTAFCTYEQFLAGSANLREFCLLRAESVNGQLNGSIGITGEEQTATANAGFVDASGIDMGSMGSNAMGFGRARGGENQAGRGAQNP